MRDYRPSEGDLTLLLAKQLGPWPPPDITLFSQIYGVRADWSDASDLALLFCYT